MCGVGGRFQPEAMPPDRAHGLPVGVLVLACLSVSRLPPLPVGLFLVAGASLKPCHQIERMACLTVDPMGKKAPFFESGGTNGGINPI